MKRLVDARGLACPQPVVLTIEAMADAEQVTTVVDNAVAVENVTRLARARGFAVEVSEKADGIYLALRSERGAAAPAGTEAEAATAAAAEVAAAGPAAPQRALACEPASRLPGPTVMLVSSDCLGRGADELGRRLMAVFFNTLVAIAPRPQKIILMNAGVKLAARGSPALEDLRLLGELGSEILACGTCLSYFKLERELAVGRISNMYDIATALLEAGRVVEL